MKKKRFNIPDIDSSLDKGDQIDRQLEEVDRVVEQNTHDNYWGPNKPRVTPGIAPWWKRSNGKTPPGKRKK